MMKMLICTLHVLVAVYFLLCMQTWSFGSESLSKYGNQTMCIESEREALLVLKQRVTNEDDLDSWKMEEEDCCKWKGVGCDNLTGHVTGLDLSSLLTPYFYIGNISLLDLPYLNYLDLSSNNLQEFPKFIWSLTNLVHLDLSNNWIVDAIPYQIGNLSKLQYLNLGHNNFLGPVPKSIGSLNSLRYLDLSNDGFWEVAKVSNELLEIFPDFGCLFNLSSLTYLHLSDINMNPSTIWVDLIQSIPSLSFMRLERCNLLSPSSTLNNFTSSISTLHLGDNNINSSIFNWLSHLSGSLKVLDLQYNTLEGKIPESFAHLTALTYLDLSRNQLNGVPKSFCKLYNLKVVDFSLNSFTGNLEDLLTGPFALLEELMIYENQITGSLPDITLLSRLRKLNVSSNQLNGILPTIFGQKSDLQLLDLSNNHLRGSLPNFTGFSSLRWLYLDNNEFSGSLPDFTGCSALQVLQLSKNQLTKWETRCSNQLNGILPTVFGQKSDLQILDLSNNHLRGSLPNFTGFSSLRELYLDNNEFSGSLPDFTGCSALQVLQLSKNQLTKWETRSTGLLSSLELLDLSMNSIRSTISEAHLFNLSRLEYILTSFNSLNFEFSSEWLPPFQLRELSVPSCKLGPKFPNWIRYQHHIDRLDISNSQISDNIPIWFGKLSSRLKLLNLSSNRIRGEFPFNLVHIEVIDLSSNYFSGPLPPFPAACSKINLSQNKFSGTLISFSVKYFALSFLDISHNKLCGELPDNWINFGLLSFLNLGYNNFSGRIPTSIGHLDFLQTLILRNNKLYGEFPASLRSCSNLGFLDFGFNKLSGKIPSWIGNDLPQLYAMILKSNRFYGSLPYGICHLKNLHFLDLSINRISGTIPLCFHNLTAMTRKGTEVGEHFYLTYSSLSSNSTDYYVDNVLARWKGQEFEYGRNFAYLKMIDLSTNEMTGELPIGITTLLDLKGLNLSTNMFSGKVPLEIGQLKLLECLDLSTNKFSGEIPPSMSGLNFLAFLDLSKNNFSGKIPSGTQLQGFSISAY